MKTENIFWRKHWSMILTFPTLLLFLYSGLWYAWNGFLLLIAIGKVSLVVALIIIFTGIPLTLLFTPAYLSIMAPFSIAEWYNENIHKNIWERSAKTILMLIGCQIGLSLWWVFIVIVASRLLD